VKICLHSNVFVVWRLVKQRISFHGVVLSQTQGFLRASVVLQTWSGFVLFLISRLGSCEYGNEPLASIKGVEFLD